MWVKYRHKFSSGVGQEWEWREVSSKDDVPELLRELADEYEWSEHYRGLDYKVFKVPPMDVLVKEIERHCEQARQHTRKADELELLRRQLHARARSRAKTRSTCRKS